MIFAATTSPDPIIAWNVILTLGVLTNLVVAWVTMSRSGKAQKREVTFGDQYVTREACGVLRGQQLDRLARAESDVSQLATQLRRNHEAVTQAATMRSAGIYTKIDQVQSALRSEIGELRNELGQKIDASPAAIITILKNTGAIK